MTASIGAMVRNITSIDDRLTERADRLKTARTATSEARVLGELQAEIAELRLYLATTISLLIYKKVIARDEFEKVSRIIDAVDGVVDGRFDGEITGDAKIKAGARAQSDLPLRELAAVVRQSGA